MTEEIRKEFEKKIHELEWTSSVKSILMIEWLKDMLNRMETPKKEEPVKEVVVELPEEKPTKRKISFRKK